MVFYTLILQFYLKNEQRKKEGDTFLRKKNRRKTKLCYHNNIYRWKRDSLSGQYEIARGIV